MDLEELFLLKKYEMLVYNKESIYFDIEEFETIIVHYISEEQYADAMEALVHAELCHPEINEFTLHKVKIMMCLENFDRAFQLLYGLEEKLPGFYEVNLCRGYVYLESDNLPCAIDEFEIAFEKSGPEFAEEFYYVPETLISQDHFDEALPFLFKFIDSGNANAKIYYQTGLCYDGLSNFEEAEKYYEISLDEDPFSEKTWIAMGTLCMNINKIDKALDAYDFALSINKNNYFASFCKSTVLLQIGEYDKAIACIVGMLEKKPNDANMLYSLGGCYEKGENLEEAGNCYIKAIEQEPGFALPYWGFSKILYAQNDIEGAIKSIDKALEFEPDNDEYLYFRGQCFISLMSDKEMLDSILQNLNLSNEYEVEKYDGSDFMNKYKKAVFFYQVGDIEQCCKYLLESVKMNNAGLNMFFNLIPKAKEDAFIINYLGKHFK
jgi:tetratricopeptide (TPR) repeat protein